MYISGFGELDWVSYTVKAGDTLGAIAKRYGVSVETIANQNNIENINTIQIGQQLDIPIEDKAFETYKNSIQARPSTMVAASAIPKVSADYALDKIGIGSKWQIPGFLQGSIFGIPKLYLYPALTVIGIVIIIRMRKSSASESTIRARKEPVYA